MKSTEVPVFCNDFVVYGYQLFRAKSTGRPCIIAEYPLILCDPLFFLFLLLLLVLILLLLLYLLYLLLLLLLFYYFTGWLYYVMTTLALNLMLPLSHLSI